MTDLIIRKTKKLSGTVKAPPSKAYTHRALIAASLSEGRSSIKEALICDDTLATVEACSMIGAKIKRVEGGFVVDGVSRPTTPKDVIYCKDSGSTLRFLTPICALAEGISVLTGNEGLRKRPMDPLLSSLRQLGVQCHSTQANGRPPIVVFGRGIRGDKTSIRGDVSSQFVSGLLFATPKARTDTEIVVTTQLESKPYVAMTIDILTRHDVKVEASQDYDRFAVPSGQEYAPFNHVIPGDYSSAAFLLAAASVLDSHIRVTNLRRETLQGDRAIIDILRGMGSRVSVGEKHVEVQGVERGLIGRKIDVHDTPDLAPVCAVLACFARGETVIVGARRLRFKESDRLASLSTELVEMGSRVAESEDGLIIQGGDRLRGAELDSHNDHRVAMACAVAAMGAEGGTVIHGIECVNKSYPNFIRDLRSLGGEILVR